MQNQTRMTSLYLATDSKVDPKGRVTMPAPLKKALSGCIHEGFVIKRSVFNNCLELYPMQEWELEMKSINQLNRFVKKNLDFIRTFMAGVKTVEADQNGRFQIPKELLTYAGINKDIVLASALNKIEIWDKVKYEHSISNISAEEFGRLAEEVMGSSNNPDDK